MSDDENLLDIEAGPIDAELIGECQSCRTIVSRLSKLYVQLYHIQQKVYVRQACRTQCSNCDYVFYTWSNSWAFDVVRHFEIVTSNNVVCFEKLRWLLSWFIAVAMAPLSTYKLKGKKIFIIWIKRTRKCNRLFGWSKCPVDICSAIDGWLDM